MNKVIAIIWKDTLLRFSSTSEWLFFLVLPIIFTVILAGGTGGPSDSRVRLVVVDQANTPLSAELVATLQQSNAVRPELMPLAQAEDEFSRRTASAVLVIPAQFNFEQIESGTAELELRQLTNNMDGLIAARAIQSVTARISASADIARSSTEAVEGIQPFASQADRQAYFETARKEAQSQMSQAPQRISVAQAATQDRDAIDYDPRANSSAGQLITWVFIPLLGISALFAYERQKGTLRRVLTTPTHQGIFLIGTITGQVLMAVVQMLLLVSFGIVVMKLNWGHDPLALLLVLVSSALAAGALGTTLGTFIKSEGQSSGLSVMLGMVMALLGGCWYPIEFFPEVVRNVTLVLPTRWAMQGMLHLVLRSQGLVDILPEVGVLLGFALVFYVVGILRFRYE